MKTRIYATPAVEGLILLQDTGDIYIQKLTLPGRYTAELQHQFLFFIRSHS